MSQRTNVSRWVCAALVVPLLLLVTIAFCDRAIAAGGGAAEMSSRVTTEGMTYDQYRQRQAEMMTKLLSGLPARALDAPVRAELTREDVRSVEQAPRLPGVPLQIGLVKGLNPRVDINGLPGARRGVGGPAKDGGYVWALAVGSAGAGSLRLHIEGMELPPSAELYFYSRVGEAFGPYRFNGPNGDGDFWTDTVFGNEGILQIHVAAPATAEALSGISFTVSGVGIILPQFAGSFTPAAGSWPCGNQSCIVDATCTNVAAANPAKSAVAKIEWAQGNFIYTCTGGLIADNNPTQGNFFLTANHCIAKNNSAGNAQFYWRFATMTCNDGCPDNAGWPFKTSGATVAATGKKGDFSLLHLNANPPSGSVILGWTSAPVANTSGADLYRISNPNFGPQVYSQHNVDTTVGTCGGWPRGNFIYSRDITGAIDGGSSGSPIVNASSQIVGQLSGTCGSMATEVCLSGPGEANATVDGAFAAYYLTVKPIIDP
ncbi:MAG TPA: trypsin-like peptidase domain-containing protein [Candidatus Polarisedimenticolia bacterium]|nr:trypsin-like peptidase domain-containing protein [Candidatus Polarisedimenticolia bacterium]